MDIVVASAIAERYAARLRNRSPEEIATTLRSIRDEELRQERLTLHSRIALADAFAEQDLRCEPDLRTADLDDPLTITLATEAHRSRWGRWIGHPVLGVTRQAVAIGLAALSALASIITIVLILPEEQRPVPVLSGDVNVAVSDFREEGGTRRGEGGRLSQSVTRALAAALPRPSASGANPDVQVRNVAPRLRVTGATPAERGESAASIARRVNATVVLAGRIVYDAADTRIEPEIYVAAGGLRDAEELAGRYSLGAIRIAAPGLEDAVGFRARLRASLVQRVNTLSAFIMGLGWFQAQEWARAQSTLRGVTGRRWPFPGSKGLPNLFVGHASGKRGDLEGAARSYRAALTLQPGFLRARFGLNEILFHRSAGDCERHANERGLRRAGRTFQLIAREAGGASLPQRALWIRAQLGRARVDVCLSQALFDDRWESARRTLLELLAATRRQPGRFRNETAEAHAALGLVYLPPADAPSVVRVASYSRARREYAAAAAQTTEPARRKEFERTVEFIDERLAGLRAP